MSRLLIAGKIVPGAEERIAEIFTESDRSELPDITGTRHRSLYRLGDLFVHLLEVDGAGPGLEAGTRHPMFIQMQKELSTCTSPYLATWRSPRDAMMTCFYRWNAPIPASGSPE